jgi:choice-of-anchor B domain-containing protein
VNRFLLIFFFYSSAVVAQEKKNIVLLDKQFEDSLVTNTSLSRYSGCWGFEWNKEEYAAIGSTEGTHFYQLSKENKLIPAGFVEGRFVSSLVIHREIKTYQNYAYTICDEGNSSLQIIDLSYLPDSVVKVADIQNIDFGKVHNLFIDTANALLFACRVIPIVAGNPLSLIPMRVFSLVDPINPVLVWEGPSDIPEVHDCYVRDNIAILNCGTDGLRVYDFTNPVSPVYLSNLTFYPDQGYNHQGWLSPNKQTYIFADETNGKRVKKCSVDANYNIQLEQLFGTNYENNSVPHNIMCTDEFAFVAYYNEGLRIFNIMNNPYEIAYYDTYTQTSSFQMNGAWGVYSNYPSERIIVSDRQNGLFLVAFDRTVFEIEATDEFSMYPNPVISNESFTIRTAEDDISEFSVSIFNGFGQIILTQEVVDQSYYTLNCPDVNGVFTIRIDYVDYLGEWQVETLKLIVQ